VCIDGRMLGLQVHGSCTNHLGLLVVVTVVWLPVWCASCVSCGLDHTASVSVCGCYDDVTSARQQSHGGGQVWLS
jgi:fumarate reductase subunit D